MKKLTLADIKPLPEYEKSRQELRRRIIELKKTRRISLGDLVTLVFENRDTLISQVQEIMRTEHLYDDEKIRHEIETYNSLIPQAGELSATLFIEITERDRVREILDQFQGIDAGDALFLELGPERITGRFEAGHSKEDKLSAVHYVRFRLTDGQQDTLRDDSVPASIVMDHPHYRARAVISKETRQSLAKDLESPDAD